MDRIGLDRDSSEQSLRAMGIVGAAQLGCLRLKVHCQGGERSEWEKRLVTTSGPHRLNIEAGFRMMVDWLQGAEASSMARRSHSSAQSYFNGGTCVSGNPACRFADILILIILFYVRRFR